MFDELSQQPEMGADSRSCPSCDLRGVASGPRGREMKSGFPRTGKGIDEETLAAVRDAAEKAGLSVSEWLSGVAAENPVRRDEHSMTRADHDADRALAEAVESLTERLRGMDEKSRNAVGGLKSRLDAI